MPADRVRAARQRAAAARRRSAVGAAPVARSSTPTPVEHARPSRAAAARAGRSASAIASAPARARCPKCGVVERSVACADAAAGDGERDERRRRASRLTGAAPRRAATGARRPVRRRGRRRASPRRRPPSRAKPPRNADERGRQTQREREDRGDDERPAEQVVQERRPCEEPWVLLVHEERGARDDERERPREPPAAASAAVRARAPSSAPPASISTSAHEPCAYMWIAEFVKNAITGQSSTPSEKASVGQRYARQRPHPPDLLAHERLAEEAQTDEQDHGAERPVDHLSAWLHPPARDRRAPAARRTA